MLKVNKIKWLVFSLPVLCSCILLSPTVPTHDAKSRDHFIPSLSHLPAPPEATWLGDWQQPLLSPVCLYLRQTVFFFKVISFKSFFTYRTRELFFWLYSGSSSHHCFSSSHSYRYLNVTVSSKRLRCVGGGKGEAQKVTAAHPSLNSNKVTGDSHNLLP